MTVTPAANALVVANHVSWLDIPVLAAQAQMRFLSKAEVRRWPLIGWMAEIAGTLFIARGGNQTTALAQRIEDRIRQGGRVAIFPEGTATDGTTVKRFHPRLFAAARHPGVRVQPVALRYGRDGAPDQIAPFVGDDDLVSHLVRVLRHPGLSVQVSFLPSFEARDLDRRRIAERCRKAILDTLALGTADTAVPKHAIRESRGPLVPSGGTLSEAS